MATKAKATKARKPKRAAKRRAARPAAKKRRQPESLRLREFSASLTVNDLARSSAWYRDMLGFTEGEQWKENGQVRGVELKAGRCELMLTQDDFAKGRDRTKGLGFRIYLTTAQDIDAIAARVKAHGHLLDFEPRKTPWGAYAFALTDPDGYKITMLRE